MIFKKLGYDSRVDGREGIIPVLNNGKFRRQFAVFPVFLYSALIYYVNSYLKHCKYLGYFAFISSIHFCLKPAVGMSVVFILEAFPNELGKNQIIRSEPFISSAKLKNERQLVNPIL